MWHMTFYMWHMTCDMWYVLGGKLLSKFQLLRSYCSWFMILWRFGGTSWRTDWLSESINYEAACRTAPATPVLLNMFWILLCVVLLLTTRDFQVSQSWSPVPLTHCRCPKPGKGQSFSLDEKTLCNGLPHQPCVSEKTMCQDSSISPVSGGTRHSDQYQSPSIPRFLPSISIHLQPDMKEWGAVNMWPLKPRISL